MPATQDQVLESLKAVIDPDLHVDIVTLGFVKEVRIDGGRVGVTIELTTPACPVKDLLKAGAEGIIAALEGVSEVEIEMTARVRERMDKPADILPGVSHIIAIASGKGGVGKSTCTVNLAVALSQTGARVGILDADVYGPSIPLMMGAADAHPKTANDKIMPIERYGLAMMSLGFLLEEGKAVLWRGPMVAGTVKQLLVDVDWGELDYLLVDLPPGTGDAPMTLAQQAPLTGVVIVSTPHNVASNIAGKSVALFRRLNTPVIGVIENMGPYIDESTGAEVRLFAGASGAELAKTLGVPYLGSIPFDPVISASGDEGRPSVLVAPNRPQAKAFQEIAGKLAQQASIVAMTRQDVTRLEKPVFSAPTA
ncbi:MAG TPA: Mrp/NBP35 family ATP-binding protein [Fimbriimonadaceae bacterium]|nr:Mrp/NBP35 family ATP-binding protein [Fimbriimonadaceae bacterium]